MFRIFQKIGESCYKISRNCLQNFATSCRFWKMLRNAILDPKICEDFAKIWRDVDKILIIFEQKGTCLARPAPALGFDRWASVGTLWVAVAPETCVATRDSTSRSRTSFPLRFLSKFCQILVKFLSNFSKIFTNFCTQDSISQHFSKSTRFHKIL